MSHDSLAQPNPARHGQSTVTHTHTRRYPRPTVGPESIHRPLAAALSSSKAAPPPLPYTHPRLPRLRQTHPGSQIDRVMPGRARRPHAPAANPLVLIAFRYGPSCCPRALVLPSQLAPPRLSPRQSQHSPRPRCHFLGARPRYPVQLGAPQKHRVAWSRLPVHLTE